MLMYLVFGLLFNLINTAITGFIGAKNHETDRAIQNAFNFAVVGFIFGFFMRWLAGLNDEHDDFLILCTIKSCVEHKDMPDGAWMLNMMKIRGRVVAGPLPVTMSLFGTLVSIITTVGTLMLAQTGITTDITYKCTSVMPPMNSTQFSASQWLIPDP